MSYKAIDKNKDMIVTLGLSPSEIYFRVLVISTSSPYTPFSSNIYYSANIISYYVKGIYIDSETSIKFVL